MADTPTRSFFTVNDLPMSKRYDVWQDSIDCIFEVDALPDIRKENFTATLEANLIGSMMLARTVSKHQFWSRSAAGIAADGMDHYILQFYNSGASYCDDGKDGTEIRPGDLMFQDLSQTAKATTSDFDNLVLCIPRQLLEDKLVFPEDHNMRFLSAGDPMVRILGDQIVSLQQNAATLSAEQGRTVEHVVAEMLASCLNTAHGNTRDAAQRRVKLETMVAIRRYFRTHFASPDLTPGRAARDLGLSRSKLYQLLEDQGGVHRYVLNLRLRHALSILNNPRAKHRPLNDIAYECGFSSDASFIRAFRAKFDMTPGDVRNGDRHATPATPSQTASNVDTRYENWLHTL